MLDAAAKIIRDSLTWTAEQFFKSPVRFYAPVSLPVMTSATRLALGTVTQGTVVYDSTLKMPMVYSGTGWQYMATGCEPS